MCPSAQALYVEIAGPEGAAVRQALPVTAGQTAEPITVILRE